MTGRWSARPLRGSTVRYLLAAATLLLGVGRTGSPVTALAVEAQTEITGARISLVRKTMDVMSVTLENRRDSPLVAWRVGVKSGGAGRGALDHGSDYSRHAIDADAGSGAIKPHERRAIEIDVTGVPDAQAATLQLVAFEDGYHEGLAPALDTWRTTRRELTDDLGFWTRAFFEMPRVSEPDVRRFIAARAAERSSDAVADPSGLRQKLLGALRQFPPGGEVWSALDRIRADAQREFAAISRRPPEGTPVDAVTLVSSVAIASQRSTAATFVGAIENLRAVPIEAYEFELVEPGSARVRGSTGTDYCPVEPDLSRRGTGPIQPHELRELPLGGRVKADEPQPRIRLAFVLFDDLSFEGDAAKRDRVLRDRETRAGDYAFMIDVFARAAVLPAADARALVLAKRAERLKQLEEEGRSGHTAVSYLDDVIRESTATPERGPMLAGRLRVTLERQRQQLLRHVRR
jgi:hypothetical protein